MQALPIDDERWWRCMAVARADRPGRGGFYSYEWLENLAGCNLRNADRIHPEWQQRTVGEIVPLHPTCGLPLAHFGPGRALVLGGWGSFVVEPIDEKSTRLISRSRVTKGWGAVSYSLLLEIPHFVMQRKMLLGIKDRAEQGRYARDEGNLSRPTAVAHGDVCPLDIGTPDHRRCSRSGQHWT
jgi:hypothetical protein